MQDFQGKVAVITGAANGIGKGLAERCAAEGMAVVLADLDRQGLQELSKRFTEQGVAHLALPTDVADPAQVEALAQRTLEVFERVDVLFNNAGVLLTGYCWERSAEDWDWILNINVKGVLNGLRAFVPIVLAQGSEAHIVNTSSPAGFLASPFLGPYTVTKQAVLAVTETLHYELQALGAKIAVHVLCPLNVATEIFDSGSERPVHSQVRGGPDLAQFEQAVAAGMAAGMSPQECADHTFRALREGRYWIFPDPSFKEAYRQRVGNVLQEANPEFSLF